MTADNVLPRHGNGSNNNKVPRRGPRDIPEGRATLLRFNIIVTVRLLWMLLAAVGWEIVHPSTFLIHLPTPLSFSLPFLLSLILLLLLFLLLCALSVIIMLNPLGELLPSLPFWSCRCTVILAQLLLSIIIVNNCCCCCCCCYYCSCCCSCQLLIIFLHLMVLVLFLYWFYFCFSLDFFATSTSLLVLVLLQLL